MKKLLLGFTVASFVALAGCGGGGAAPAVESEEASLVQQIRLDRVKPPEIAATYAARLRPDLEACVARHPEITHVDAQNLKVFYRVGVVWHWDVKYAVQGMLAEGGGAPIPTAELSARLEPYATAVLSRHVDADGFFVWPREGLLDFYEAVTATQEEKALSLAKDPGGKSLREIRAMWREVQEDRGNLDSAWLNPVKVGGPPTLGDVRKAMGIGRGVGYQSWGHDAVEDFHQAPEGPEEASAFDPIAAALRGPGIKKRWYFAGGGDEWSRNYLVVLDEHDQLWGFMMGYTE